MKFLQELSGFSSSECLKVLVCCVPAADPWGARDSPIGVLFRVIQVTQIRCRRHLTKVANHFNGWYAHSGKRRAFRYATTPRKSRIFSTKPSLTACFEPYDVMSPKKRDNGLKRIFTGNQLVTTALFIVQHQEGINKGHAIANKSIIYGRNERGAMPNTTWRKVPRIVLRRQTPHYALNDSPRFAATRNVSLQFFL